jgi:hypothetical protein
VATRSDLLRQRNWMLSQLTVVDIAFVEVCLFEFQRLSQFAQNMTVPVLFYPYSQSHALAFPLNTPSTSEHV